jgi:hypothetical protein
MGFFNIELERNILLHPAHFGPRMREILYERLRGEARRCLAMRMRLCAASLLCCAEQLRARARAAHRWRAPAVGATASWCW